MTEWWYSLWYKLASLTDWREVFIGLSIVVTIFAFIMTMR